MRFIPVRCLSVQQLGCLFALFACASVAAASQASAGDATASLHGTVTVESSTPVPAIVKVHSVTGDEERSTEVISDGSFAIQNLKAGQYLVSASKEGFKTSAEIQIALFAGQSADVHLTLARGEKAGFLKRLGRSYADDWKGSAVSSGPDPARRALPSPLNSPPFPSSDWSYGGAPEIGTPDTNVPPLMEALYGGPHGQAWRDSRVKVYGWIEGSFNLSTSSHSNSPAAYDIYSNRIELDQAVLYVERIPDSVQTDHIDWGFHLSGLYGSSYRFTANKGYFSQQLLNQNREYGFDPVLEYFDLYVPQVADGLNIRVGRFISVPGIEAQLAPNNYVYTHSLLYSIDPFTDTGIMATLKLNDRWIAQVGITASHDVAPWTPDARLSLTACVSYTFDEGNDNVYPCVNGINGGQYAYDNLQMFDVTWYHKFNSSWHMATESWYMYQKNVPSIGGPVQPETGTHGAFCSAGEIRCVAPEWAAVHYLEKQLSAKSYLSIRSDYLNDSKGQRTGYKTPYAEETLMWGRWVGSTILLRPELRFDHAFDARAYDNGTRSSQFQLAMDVIVKF